MRDHWPRAPELAVRAALSGAVVLALGRLAGPALCRTLLPLLVAVVSAMAPDFTVLDAAVLQGGAGDLLRVAATPAHALVVAGAVLHPFGTGGIPPGGFRVSLTVGGMLGASELLLIVALAWPARNRRELALRLGIALLMASMLLLAAPLTLVAELWGGVQGLMRSGHVPGILVASRLLMGGGGAALALAGGVLSIWLAARTTASGGESSPSARVPPRRFHRSCEPRLPGGA